jgi:hypothetical protein
MSLQPTDLENLLKVQDIIKPCLDSPCEMLVFDHEIRDWMANRWYYSFHLKNIDQKIQAKEDLASAISGLQRRLKQDFFSFRTEKLPHNKINEQGEVIVNMHVESSDLKSGLEKYFSKEWSQHGLKIKIQWLEVATLNMFSHVLFKLKPVGARGSFKYGSETVPAAIEVPQIVRSGTLSHEFGHALGLTDRYFEIFDTERCAYDVWHNEADIMSNSSVGRVLPVHAKEILSGIK